MNLTDDRYNRFGLVRDMLATPDIIQAFDPDQARITAAAIAKAGKLFMTGEGSSRIFPAKNLRTQAMRGGWKIALATDGARQAQEYDLSGWAVFALSNSGKTSEIIKLYQDLKAKGHPDRFSLIATPDTMLQGLAAKGYVLSCGKEGAVAATKSVQEQALFYQTMLEHAVGRPTITKSALSELATAMRQALTASFDPALIKKIAAADTIYFAGRNDGVAEELTLKTNEITRKKSDYLEGTYAVHGIEEVMNPNDVVIWIDPYQDSEAKFADVLVKGVKMTLITIADRQTAFPTLRVPSVPRHLSGYVMMAAGWNLLVEVGIALNIDLDKPQRARKVGNEFVG